MTRPEAIAEDAWTLQSRWTTEAEAITEARALIAHDANGLTREGCTVEITGDGLMYLWRVGDSIARSVTVRVREVSVRVPASDVPTPTGTPATRLARLAIELSGVVPDPRSLAALEAVERDSATPGTMEEAKAATEDARGRTAEMVALAVEAAVGARIYPAQCDALTTHAATRAMDAVRYRGLNAAREVVSATNGRPWTEADADAERAALQAITPALRAALARVREILPGYAPDDDARKWLDRPTPDTIRDEDALTEARAACVAIDQRDALTVGASTWAITYAGGQRGQMSEWPDGRGAIYLGGPSEWGDWEGDELVTESGERYTRDGSRITEASA